MSSIYDSRQRLKYVFICAATLIAVASVVVSNLLVKDLAQEERQKMEVLSVAQRVVTSEDANLNMLLALKIITGNSSIPVILCDENEEIISSNNLQYTEKDSAAYEQRKLQELKLKNPPVVIDFNDGTYHYLYYDDSIILKRLNIYPYAQLAIVFIFILIAFLALSSTKRAEQNKVWVGLSKETAHQLGTPISSLMAWTEYLRTKDVDPPLLDEMDKDVKRLETIAERFSKIGSNPDPIPVDIRSSVLSALDYMKTRISAKVKIQAVLPEKPVPVLMNDSLFAWVIENLVKNAADAMEGQGEITFRVEDGRRHVCIDISDTGKGIPKSKFKTVFSPGYTTKARGWGLGLSLVKRIIESYHNGRIFVKSSELGKGTTFRIELKKHPSLPHVPPDFAAV
ncbi:Sporulation kinase E [Bacteroidales bacterium Barb6]|nr:Sporulation kinase E [Bacteroidales bacterium Barb6]